MCITDRMIMSKVSLVGMPYFLVLVGIFMVKEKIFLKRGVTQSLQFVHILIMYTIREVVLKLSQEITLAFCTINTSYFLHIVQTIVNWSFVHIVQWYFRVDFSAHLHPNIPQNQFKSAYFTLKSFVRLRVLRNYPNEIPILRPCWLQKYRKCNSCSELASSEML